MVRVADRIFDYLADSGIEDVFTVSGGGSIFLDDALATTTRLRYHCCHHEQAVAMATEAYARVKGEIGVSVVTTGPGGTNAITGVAGSWIDSVPQLVISGQVYLSQTIGSSGLRQLGVQELNIVDLVRPVTKYAILVEDPKRALYEIQKAIHIATTGRPGPVWVDIPADIQNARLEEAEFETFRPEEGSPVQYDSHLVEKVAQIAEALRGAERPLVHVGQGIKLAGCVDDFFDLVELYKIPFVTARNANELVDSDHHLYAGRPGTYPQRCANLAVQNADVYIAVGTRLSLSQTSYNSKDFARNAFKVMVDIDKTELEKKTLDLDIRVHCDARAFFEELSRQLSGATIRSSSWVKQCQDWRARYPVVLPEHRAQSRYVNSYYFTDVLSDLLVKDDIVVTDMGLAFQGTHQAFRVKKGQHLLTNSGFASMGWGLPAAFGASVAAGGARVVCIAGDGGVHMTIQELATVMHHDLPVKLFIYNNGGYSTIKQTQEVGFGGRLMGCNPETGLSFPDFVKLGEAYGIKSVRLENHANLKEQVSDVLDGNGPAICELMIDPDQPQIPKILPKRLTDGRTEPSRFEDLYPFLPPEELRENMVAEEDEL
jgi:acetolactate synthase I/II/III large subunit